MILHGGNTIFPYTRSVCLASKYGASPNEKWFFPYAYVLCSICYAQVSVFKHMQISLFPSVAHRLKIQMKDGLDKKLRNFFNIKVWKGNNGSMVVFTHMIAMISDFWVEYSA